MHGFDVIKPFANSSPTLASWCSRAGPIPNCRDSLPRSRARICGQDQAAADVVGSHQGSGGGGIYIAAKGDTPEPLHQPEHGPVPSLPVVAGSEPLSPREVEVAKLVAEGYASKEIADKLALSVRTVEKHRANIMDKRACGTSPASRVTASTTGWCGRNGANSLRREAIPKADDRFFAIRPRSVIGKWERGRIRRIVRWPGTCGQSWIVRCRRMRSG